MSQPYAYPVPPGPPGPPFNQPGPSGYPAPGPQTPYNQTPYNQTPYNQTPYNQTPYNQTPYNQTPYNPYAQAPDHQPPYGPPGPGYPVAPQPRPLPRPGVVGMAAFMTVTASLQWICVLSFAWLVATVGIQDLPTDRVNIDSGVYHAVHRFHLGMIDGLAWPLYLFPAAAFVLGFLVLVPRPWARWALSGIGLAALAWSAWWLRNDMVWWLPPALYVLVACLVLWTPAATRWYRARGRAVSPS